MSVPIKATTAAENVFYAEDCIVRITPRFEHPVMNFLSGDFGPFETDSETEVPLWLAIELKKNEKCKLQKPEWLSVEFLENTIGNEKAAENLQSIPYHYMELAQLILTNFKDEFTETDKILALLQDLENVRMDRLRSGLEKIAENVKDGQKTESVIVTNIGSMEVLAIQNFVIESLVNFDALFPDSVTNRTEGAPLPQDGVGGAVSNAGRGRKLRKHRP